ADPQNHFDLDSNQKLDLRLTLLSGPTELSLWGDNLLDERNQFYGFFYAPGVISTVPSRGRTWGIGAAYHF
ncbi:MAG: TonB-dependent receptor, partial [Pseudomonadota bacterium]